MWATLSTYRAYHVGQMPDRGFSQVFRRGFGWEAFPLACGFILAGYFRPHETTSVIRFRLFRTGSTDGQELNMSEKFQEV